MGVGFASAHSIIGFGHHKAITRERVGVEGGESITYAEGLGGIVAYKKGTIGPKSCRILLQLIVGEPQDEHFIKHTKGESGIAASTSEAGTKGNVFAQTNVHRRHLGIIVQQEVVGLDADIVFGGTINRDACLREEAMGCLVIII